MTTTSYPAAGNGGVSSAQWAKMQDAPDGICNDYTGGSLFPTFVSASNTVSVSVGLCRINGYYLEVTATESLAVPTAAGTYYLVAFYDPALNVPLPNTTPPQANPNGPCRLTVSSTATPPGEQVYLLIAPLTRASSGAAPTVEVVRQHVGSAMRVATMPTGQLSDPEVAVPGVSFPLGTEMFEENTGETYRRVVKSAGVLQWQRQSRGDQLPFPAASGLVASGGTPATYWVSDQGARVNFEGTLQRSSGSSLTNGNDVVLGTMPSGSWPRRQVRFSCVGKPPSGWRTVQITVRSDNGQVILYDPDGFECDYVDLSGISYRVKD